MTIKTSSNPFNWAVELVRNTIARKTNCTENAPFLIKSGQNNLTFAIITP